MNHVICQYNMAGQRKIEALLCKLEEAESIYIYGAGERGKALFNWLKYTDVAGKIEGVIETNPEQSLNRINELKTISIKEIHQKMTIIVSPYENESILNSLIEIGFVLDTNVFDLGKMDIPVLSERKIKLDEEMFDNISAFGDESTIGKPIPVFCNGIVVSYFCIRSDLDIYQIILHEYKNLTDERTYSSLKNKVYGFTLYSSITDEIINLLKSKGISAGYVIDDEVLKDNIPSIKQNRISIDSDMIYVDEDYRMLNEIDITHEILCCNDIFDQLTQNGVNVILVRLPHFYELSFVSREELYRHNNNVTGYSLHDVQEIKRIYGEEYDLFKNGDIGNLTQRFNGKYTILNDVRGLHTNVMGGERFTTNQPNKDLGNIYFLGPCTIASAFTSDKNTIPSQIQSMLNSEKILRRVNNLGTLGGIRKYVERIKRIDFWKGDYLFLVDVFDSNLFDSINNKIQKIDLLDAYNERNDNNIFFEEPYHMSVCGNRMIAKYLYREVDLRKPYTKQKIKRNSYFDYSKRLDLKRIFKDGTIGSIVLNGNPFSFGHEYLIKEAVKRCDYLYVFVVEEDASYYSFEERFEMAKAACSKYKNIEVLPSGRMILSNDTLPEYFNKDNLQNAIVDASYDINIYGAFVCPKMGITMRFVGEEPFDTVTNQYNTYMKRLLPQYGVEVIEIPRLLKNNKVISATEVRMLVNEKKYDEVRMLVPQTTYDIISRRWN